MKKLLILIRDKLGDSLIAAQAVLALRDQYPEYHITLMIRSDYAYFLKQESGLSIVRYRNYIQVWFRIMLFRLNRPFDAFIVLRGFGKKIIQLGKLVKAHRKIYLKSSFAEVFNEYPAIVQSSSLIEGVCQTLRVYAPKLVIPQKLYFASLATQYCARSAFFIGICPITDERRKNLSPNAVQRLIHYIQQQHPNVPIYILVRTVKEGTHYRFAVPEIQVLQFKNTRRLFKLFTKMRHYYGADTGLYHLAAAMNIPATVLFGPTQPSKVILAGQQKTVAIRLYDLAEKHCEEKRCQHAVCLEQATNNLMGVPPNPLELNATLISCPLRTISLEKLADNRIMHKDNYSIFTADS